MNSIFVNVETSDLPNKPKYVRNIRRTAEFIQKENETSPDTNNSSSEEISDEEDLLIDSTRNKKMNLIPKLKKHLPKNKTVKTKPSFAKNIDISNQNHVVKSVPEFMTHIPQNGCYFLINGKQVQYINSCTIDNHLFAFWVMSKLIPQFKEKISYLSKDLFEIIDNIDKIK